ARDVFGFRLHPAGLPRTRRGPYRGGARFFVCAICKLTRISGRAHLLSSRWKPAANCYVQVSLTRLLLAPASINADTFNQRPAAKLGHMEALMQMSLMHYLPLAPGFFAILVGFFFIVLVLRSVRYAYESLGVSSNAAIFLLFATLIGSIFNIPIEELPPARVASNQVIDFFGMRYIVPVVS